MDVYPPSSTPRRNTIHTPTVPAVGRVYFDTAQNRWYLAQESGGKIWLKRTSVLFPYFPFDFDYDYGRQIGWEEGAKLMVWGQFSDTTPNTLLVVHAPLCSKENHRVLQTP